MIRKFIQCKSAEERLKVLSETKEQDWSEENLNTIMEIIGIREDEELNKEQKWSKILCHLLETTFQDKKALEGSLFKDNPEIEKIYRESLEGLTDLQAYVKVCNYK